MRIGCATCGAGLTATEPLDRGAKLTSCPSIVYAIHDPAKVVCDLAITLALGGDCLADVALLRAEPDVYGQVASDPTMSRTGCAREDSQNVPQRVWFDSDSLRQIVHRILSHSERGRQSMDPICGQADIFPCTRLSLTGRSEFMTGGPSATSSGPTHMLEPSVRQDERASASHRARR